MIQMLAILFLCVLSGCSPKQTDAGDTRKEAISKKELMTMRPECDLLQRYPESMKEIQENPQLLTGIYIDSCFFALVDTLTNSYLKTGDTHYIACLDAIGSVTDGFTGEYMSAAAVAIYRERSIDVIKYLYADKRYDGDGIEQSLILGVRGELHWPSSSVSLSGEIDSITAAISRSELMSQKEKEYLDWLDSQWQLKEDKH